MATHDTPKRKKRRAAPRPVDIAMGAERPEKSYMRQQWAIAARNADHDSRALNVPLFLTLSGAKGLDIDVLIRDGLILQTETGAIAPESQERLIAVERSPDAVIELKHKFPGLKIRGENLACLLRGDKLTRYPDRNDSEICRAAVVNLDLDEILEADQEDNNISFPVMNQIKKLSVLHATNPRVNWCLCLTLHGEIRWSEPVWQSMQVFLSENFRNDQDFSDTAREFLGGELHGQVIAERIDQQANLNVQSQQRLLMLFVPKKIAHLVNADGWTVRTEQNVRYGGNADCAPMVSWVLKFESYGQAGRGPQHAYTESLRSILSAPSYIDEVGQVNPG